MTEESVSGFCFRLAENNPTILWKSKKQNSVVLSRCEAKFIAILLASQETQYLRPLLRTMMDLESLRYPTTIHCDNQSSIVLAKNNNKKTKQKQNKTVVHQRSKHIDIKFQFIRDEINKGSILLEFVETEKCSRRVHEANDGNKIKHFQKNYSR